MGYDYQGEIEFKIEDTEFKDYTPADWAMYHIERYGQIDGDHHKGWVLDQVARILKGTNVTIKRAHWIVDGKKDHYEWRINTEDEPSAEYKQWVIDMCDGEDGPETYSYDEGIAP